MPVVFHLKTLLNHDVLGLVAENSLDRIEQAKVDAQRRMQLSLPERATGTVQKSHI